MDENKEVKQPVIDIIVRLDMRDKSVSGNVFGGQAPIEQIAEALDTFKRYLEEQERTALRQRLAELESALSAQKTEEVE